MLGRLFSPKALLVLAFGSGLFAFAQGGDSLVIPEDLGTLFVSTHSLAAFVIGLVAFLRKHLLKSLDGLFVVGLSLLLSVLFSFFGFVRGYLGGDWLWFGLLAGLEASGLVSVLKTLLGGGLLGGGLGGGLASLALGALLSSAKEEKGEEVKKDDEGKAGPFGPGYTRLK